MASRKCTRDAIDKFWRNWLKRKGFSWIDYEKTKVSEIDVTYAVEIPKVNSLMNEAYRAGFFEGMRIGKIAGIASTVEILSESQK